MQKFYSVEVFIPWVSNANEHCSKIIYLAKKIFLILLEKILIGRVRFYFLWVYYINKDGITCMHVGELYTYFFKINSTKKNAHNKKNRTRAQEDFFCGSTCVLTAARGLNNLVEIKLYYIYYFFRMRGLKSCYKQNSKTPKPKKIKKNPKMCQTGLWAKNRSPKTEPTFAKKF